MEALFGLVILFTSIDLLYIRSQAAASRDTSTLSGLAAILVVNPDVATVCAALWRSSIAAALEPRPSWWKFTALRRRLRAILPGSSGLSTPKKRPSFWNFSTAIQRTNGRQDFSMLAEEDAERYLPDSITPFLSRWKWWQPLTLRPKFRTTVLSLTAAIVAALEVLLRFSQKLNGLGIINHDNELHYAWTLPAALTMVLLKLYVHACDFGFRQLGPYHALRERTTFTRAMSYNPLNSIACNTVTKGWRRRQWSIVLASTASILAALLPVVISGLFSPELVSSQRITLLEPWWFNTSTRGNAGHNGDGMAVADLVLHNNYSMPTWTTRSLALGASQPPIEGGIATSIDPDHPDQIKVTVPSISSLLKCVKHTGVESYCRAVISERTNSGSRFYYYQLPEPLSRGGHLTNTTASCVEQWVSALSVIARDKYFGYFIESGYLYGSISSGDKQPPDQPHFVWGQNIGGDIAQITFLRCQETVHELDVEATFSIPSLELDTGTPPTPLWSTMRKSNMPVLLNRPDLLSKVPTEQSLDWFFQALVYGKYAIAVEHLGNVTSENIVTDAIKNLTSMYRAIEYSIDGRIGSNHNSIKQQSKPAVLTGEQNLRLVQNAASTHALAGLLGLISVLVATACWAMDTGQLVPTEPSSIAATASFFANLNIFDRRYLPEGSEWLSDKQMVRRGVLQGIGFGAILPAALVSRLSKKKSQSVSTPRRVNEADAFIIIAIDDKVAPTSQSSSDTQDDSTAPNEAPTADPEDRFLQMSGAVATPPVPTIPRPHLPNPEGPSAPQQPSANFSRPRSGRDVVNGVATMREVAPPPAVLPSPPMTRPFLATDTDDIDGSGPHGYNVSPVSSEDSVGRRSIPYQPKEQRIGREEIELNALNEGATRRRPLPSQAGQMPGRLSSASEGAGRGRSQVTA